MLQQHQFRFTEVTICKLHHRRTVKKLLCLLRIVPEHLSRAVIVWGQLGRRGRRA